MLGKRANGQMTEQDKQFLAKCVFHAQSLLLKIPTFSNYPLTNINEKLIRETEIYGSSTVLLGTRHSLRWGTRPTELILHFSQFLSVMFQHKDRSKLAAVFNV